MPRPAASLLKRSFPVTRFSQNPRWRSPGPLDAAAGDPVQRLVRPGHDVVAVEADACLRGQLADHVMDPLRAVLGHLGQPGGPLLLGGQGSPGGLPAARGRGGGGASAAPGRGSPPRSRIRRRGWREQCRRQGCAVLRTTWRSLQSIIDRVVTDLVGKTDRLAGLRRIGIDDISYWKRRFRCS